MLLKLLMTEKKKKKKEKKKKKKKKKQFRPVFHDAKSGNLLSFFWSNNKEGARGEGTKSGIGF